MSYYENRPKTAGANIQAKPCRNELEHRLKRVQEEIKTDTLFIDGIDRFLARNGRHMLSELKLETAYATVSQNCKQAEGEIVGLIKELESLDE